MCTVSIARKTLVLHQKTPFCEFACKMVKKKFGDRVLCESFSTYAEGRAMMDERGSDAPALLIWGDGRNHHLSNVLNIPGSLKYVFDNHGDDLDGAGSQPQYDNHNRFSRTEGTSVRVCYRIDGNGRLFFSSHDEGKGNGTLHASVDLDFIEGFPALPWMSVGDNEPAPLHDYLASLTARHPLRRLDIGGYHEMEEPDERQMAAVYSAYYEGLIARLLPAFAPAA